MSVDSLYLHCRTATGGLLAAIDSRDVRGAEDELSRLRSYLSSRDKDTEVLSDRLYEERLDALEGVTEALARSLRRKRRSLQPPMHCMEEAAPLLRHLTA